MPNPEQNLEQNTQREETESPEEIFVPKKPENIFLDRLQQHEAEKFSQAYLKLEADHISRKINGRKYQEALAKLCDLQESIFENRYIGQTLACLGVASELLHDVDDSAAKSKQISEMAAVEVGAGVDPIPKLKEAMDIALQDSYRFTKVNAVLKVAVVASKAGNGTEPVMSIVDGIFDEVQDKYQHAELLKNIAAAKVEMGDTEGAYETIEKIEDDYKQEKPRGLIKISLVQFKLGLDPTDAINKAVAATETLPYVDSKSKIFEEIALVQQEMGLDFIQAIAEAEKFAREIESTTNRSQQLAEIAISKHRLGLDPKETLQAAYDIATNEIEELYYVAHSLKKVAVAYAAVGEVAKAKLVIDAIDDKEARELSFLEVSGALADSGNYKEAQSMADKIKDLHDKSWALKHLAIKMSEVGKTVEAQKIARGIRSESEKSDALISIGKAHAAKGDFDSAYTIVKQLKYSSSKAKLLVEIAKSYLTLGKTITEI